MLRVVDDGDALVAELGECGGAHGGVELSDEHGVQGDLAEPAGQVACERQGLERRLGRLLRVGLDEDEQRAGHFATTPSR